jgi:hypothetical protein
VNEPRVTLRFEGNRRDVAEVILRIVGRLYEQRLLTIKDIAELPGFTMRDEAAS